jgi:hypothetical protein
VSTLLGLGFATQMNAGKDSGKSGAPESGERSAVSRFEIGLRLLGAGASYTLARGVDLSVVGVVARLFGLSVSLEKTSRQRSLEDAIAALEAASAFVQELEIDSKKGGTSCRKYSTSMNISNS